MDSSNETNKLPEIFSKALRAGRRTYFFDVRETKAGDYYLTITESKKSFSDDGDASYRKHKIYLYKEDFSNFLENLQEATDFIYKEKGEEVISEKHQKDYYQQKDESETSASETSNTEEVKEEENNKKDNLSDFTDVNFDDI